MSCHRKKSCSQNKILSYDKTSVLNQEQNYNSNTCNECVYSLSGECRINNSKIT
ncbi:MAG: hypothetical protein LBJ93_01665 [Clostridiales bacterium]|nr:hypothetical protein [Clostridiales bacterium]